MIAELKQQYRERGAAAIAQREAVEKIADEISAKGFENIFFAGSGGSITTLTPFPRIIRKLSKIPAYWEEAAELMVSDYRCLTKDSLVVIMAKTGTMKETVELSRYCKDRGIPTVGLVMLDHTPVADNVTYKILIDEFSSPIRYLTIYYFVFRLLHNHGDFPEYQEFARELSSVPEALCGVLDAYDERAREFAGRYAREEFQLWLYSGINFGEALKYSADIAEELFRQKTQVMNTAEFFHGCLEIADDTVNIVLLKGEDESRALDERCEGFLRRYAAKKLVVLDTAQFPLPGVSQKHRRFLSPILLNVCIEELIAPYMMEATGRSAKTRRYYQLVDY